MNDDCQIAAEMLHNVHFIPNFNSKTTGLMFTKFLYDVHALMSLLMHALGDIVFRFGMFYVLFAKSEGSQLRRLQKASKSN